MHTFAPIEQGRMRWKVILAKNVRGSVMGNHVVVHHAIEHTSNGSAQRAQLKSQVRQAQPVEQTPSVTQQVSHSLSLQYLKESTVSSQSLAKVPRNGAVFKAFALLLSIVFAVCLMSILAPSQQAYAADNDAAFAIYSEEDNSLAFYTDDTLPNVGETYHGQYVSEIYTDFTDRIYDQNNSIPWYSHRSSITSVTVDDSFYAVQPIACKNWFAGFTKCTSMDLTYLDTSQARDMSKMFDGCSALTELNVTGFDTSSVTDMYWMFGGCSKLESLDASCFDTSNVTDMSYMFSSCKALTGCDVSNFDTSNVETMSHMFSSCSVLTSLDVSHFDTHNVTDMEQMFHNCQSLTFLDVSDFDTSNVTSMYSMFNSCYALVSPNVSNWDTSNVTSMRTMFSYCSSLTYLDLSSFDTSNVTSYTDFLGHASSLKYVTVGENFDLFAKSTSSLTNIKTWYDNAGNIVSDNYLIGVDTAGTYYTCPVELTAFAIYSDDDNSLTFYYSGYSVENKIPCVGDPYVYKTVTEIYTGFDEDNLYSSAADLPWYDNRDNITRVIFDKTFKDIALTSVAYWFSDYPNLETLDLTYLDTTNIDDVQNYQDFLTESHSLKYLTVGESFDLFAKTDIPLVDIKIWYDVDENIVSDNYLIGISDPGTYYTYENILTYDMFTVDTTYGIYDGVTPVTKEIVGYKGETPLIEGIDYSVSYRQNNRAGTATITITGIGDYSGSLEYSFKVIRAFDDIGASITMDNNWYFNAVYGLANLGIITGYNQITYGAGYSMTRADLVTILWRYCEPDAYANYNESAAKNETNLPDIEDGTYWTGAANWAVSNDIVTGYQLLDGSYAFEPDDSITFDQLITVIARYVLGFDGAESYDTYILHSTKYTDGHEVDDWAMGSMAWAIENKIVTGNNNGDGTYTLAPLSDVARERAATVLYRTINEGLL